MRDSFLLKSQNSERACEQGSAQNRAGPDVIHTTNPTVHYTTQKQRSHLLLTKDEVCKYI